jgi:hypothetical protein
MITITYFTTEGDRQARENWGGSYLSVCMSVRGGDLLPVPLKPYAPQNCEDFRWHSSMRIDSLMAEMFAGSFKFLYDEGGGQLVPALTARGVVRTGSHGWKWNKRNYVPPMQLKGRAKKGGKRCDTS